jgi:hypothetical protein
MAPKAAMSWVFQLARNAPGASSGQLMGVIQVLVVFVSPLPSLPAAIRPCCYDISQMATVLIRSALRHRLTCRSGGASDIGQPASSGLSAPDERHSGRDSDTRAPPIAGTERCSCAMRQWPSTLRRPTVSRNTRPSLSLGSLDEAGPHHAIATAKATSASAVTVSSRKSKALPGLW